MLYSIHFQFVLIADKCKITPKGEILDLCKKINLADLM